MSIQHTRVLEALKTGLRPAAFVALVFGTFALGAATDVTPAKAEELRPVEARSLQLGNLSGVAYYTVQEGGYRLVATLAAREGTPVRFESTLLPGQTIVVSIPGFEGAVAQSAEFSRQGDHLVVVSAPVPTE